MARQSEPTSPDDFDFIIGHWDVRHRRLNSRLSNCEEWTSFSGLMSTHKILQGFGNIEDNVLRFPQGDVRAAALRSFDPSSRTWAIWWLDGRAPHELDVPVVGSFSAGVGVFYAQNEFEGQTIKIRFIWKSNPGANPTWEQAFSPDGGKSWETNWTMEFSRRDA